MEEMAQRTSWGSCSVERTSTVPSRTCTSAVASARAMAFSCCRISSAFTDSMASLLVAIA